MFFCAGFFHCFLILNQTEIGCENQCKELHASVAGVSKHSFFDTARELLERRGKTKSPDSEAPKENKFKPPKPEEKQNTKFYTDFAFDFTSKKWINAHETYDHAKLTRDTNAKIKYSNREKIRNDVKKARTEIP